MPNEAGYAEWSRQRDTADPPSTQLSQASSGLPPSSLSQSTYLGLYGSSPVAPPPRQQRALQPVGSGIFPPLLARLGAGPSSQNAPKQKQLSTAKGKKGDSRGTPAAFVLNSKVPAATPKTKKAQQDDARKRLYAEMLSQSRSGSESDSSASSGRRHSIFSTQKSTQSKRHSQASTNSTEDSQESQGSSGREVDDSQASASSEFVFGATSLPELEADAPHRATARKRGRPRKRQRRTGADSEDSDDKQSDSEDEEVDAGDKAPEIDDAAMGDVSDEDDEDRPDELAEKVPEIEWRGFGVFSPDRLPTGGEEPPHHQFMGEEIEGLNKRNPKVKRLVDGFEQAKKIPTQEDTFFLQFDYDMFVLMSNQTNLNAQQKRAKVAADGKPPKDI